MQRRIPRSRIRRTAAAVAATAGVLALTACGSGFSEPQSSGGSAGALTSGDDALTVLIGSSGDAETAAVKAQVAAWSKSSGTKATVQAASDLNQQLSQGFASGKPADVFYLGADTFANYAKQGSLLAYGDRLKNKDDFYPALVTNFTYDGKFTCAPKDFSTLALQINTKLWDAAGLTDDDVPTSWDELKAVAQKLTSGKVTGLVTSNEYQRLGAFMVEAGGNLMNDTSTEATADSAANKQALTYVQDGLKDGWWKFTTDVGAGWGGEAFGKGLAAMTIEGNWITGAMTNDFPDIDYTVVPLPAGPSGKGTLQFTNCWGIAADSPNQAGALQLVEQLTSQDDQLAFAKAFGPMPSIESAADGWKQVYPDYSAFIDSADFAKGVPTAAGATDVVTDVNSKLAALKNGDIEAILGTAQKNLTALQG